MGSRCARAQHINRTRWVAGSLAPNTIIYNIWVAGSLAPYMNKSISSSSTGGDARYLFNTFPHHLQEGMLAVCFQTLFTIIYRRECSPFVLDSFPMIYRRECSSFCSSIGERSPNVLCCDASGRRESHSDVIFFYNRMSTINNYVCYYLEFKFFKCIEV